MHSHSRAYRAKKGDKSLLERISEGWRNVDVRNSKRYKPYFVRKAEALTYAVCHGGTAAVRTAVAREQAEARMLPKVLPHWA